MHHPKSFYRTVRRHRSGLMAVEILVAASLLLCVMGSLAVGIVAYNRVERSARQYRLAVNELTNQLSKLSSLDRSSRKKALEALQLSPEAAQSLRDGAIAGQWIEDDDGARIRLSIQWNRGGDSNPLEMTAWMASDNRTKEPEVANDK